MKIFSSFHINTQLLMTVWIQNQEIKYNFFFLAPTLDTNNAFEYKLKILFLLSHNTVHSSWISDIFQNFSPFTSPDLMTYFQKKFRFPFLAPYLYASSCFVADFCKKFVFLLLINIGNEKSSLLTKSENFHCIKKYRYSFF